MRPGVGGGGLVVVVVVRVLGGSYAGGFAGVLETIAARVVVPCDAVVV